MLNLLASFAADPNTWIVLGGLFLVALLCYVALVVATYFKHRRR